MTVKIHVFLLSCSIHSFSRVTFFITGRDTVLLIQRITDYCVTVAITKILFFFGDNKPEFLSSCSLNCV